MDHPGCVEFMHRFRLIVIGQSAQFAVPEAAVGPVACQQEKSKTEFYFKIEIEEPGSSIVADLFNSVTEEMPLPPPIEQCIETEGDRYLPFHQRRRSGSSTAYVINEAVPGFLCTGFEQAKWVLPNSRAPAHCQVTPVHCICRAMLLQVPPNETS